MHKYVFKDHEQVQAVRDVEVFGAAAPTIFLAEEGRFSAIREEQL